MLPSIFHDYTKAGLTNHLLSRAQNPDAGAIHLDNHIDTLTRAIGLIHDLFQNVGSRSANADIMGDIFEHLLEEIRESGKNGQFRTPRHVIRDTVRKAAARVERGERNIYKGK